MVFASFSPSLHLPLPTGRTNKRSRQGDSAYGTQSVWPQVSLQDPKVQDWLTHRSLTGSECAAATPGTQPAASRSWAVQGCSADGVCQRSLTFGSRPQIINSFSKWTQEPLFLRHTSSYRLQSRQQNLTTTAATARTGKGSY